MSPMLNVIMRLGLPGNSTLENRFLSVDIASTLFYWDQRAAREDASGRPSKSDALESQPTDVAVAENATSLLAMQSNFQPDGEHHSR